MGCPYMMEQDFGMNPVENLKVEQNDLQQKNI